LINARASGDFQLIWLIQIDLIDADDAVSYV
jgi:hypothetical protein